MILKANVGVGILGKEGQQAARSADYYDTWKYEVTKYLGIKL